MTVKRIKLFKWLEVAWGWETVHTGLGYALGDGCDVYSKYWMVWNPNRNRTYMKRYTRHTVKTTQRIVQLAS